MDSPEVVDLGISQMLSLVMEDDSDAAELDVVSTLSAYVNHLLYSFESFLNISLGGLYAGTYGWWL